MFRFLHYMSDTYCYDCENFVIFNEEKKKYNKKMKVKMEIYMKTQNERKTLIIKTQKYK